MRVEHHHSSTHPLLPPTTEDDRIARLRLLRSRRVGIATYHRLIAEHGSAAAALNALPEIARAAGLDRYEAATERAALAEMRAGAHARARLIFQGEAAFPARLADLSDAPPFLWAVGDIAALARPMVALVGARNASSLGTRMARALAQDLGAAGYVVVSGLARGVDAAAHAGSIATGTVAVLAGGVDVLYPQENARLGEDIPAAGGVRLSEHPPGLQPQARHFPARNRIVSGLAEAVVVVEAAAKSGSLITARAALDQGREVLAVPGHPFDARAGGCNMLIRDGARLVRGAADVIEAIGPGPDPVVQGDLPLDAVPCAAHEARGARTGPETSQAKPGHRIASRVSTSRMQAGAVPDGAQTTHHRDGGGKSHALAAPPDTAEGAAAGDAATQGGGKTENLTENGERGADRREDAVGPSGQAPRHARSVARRTTAPTGTSADARRDQSARGEEARTLSETAALHARILDRLGPSPLAEDQLIRDLGQPSGTVAPALTDLELDGRIRRQPGGLLALAP
ncbi:DNA-processing protein DprA [Roseivivax marinus]|nr:DNA-processing protein DprA [Roseivivax marinus]UMA63805.1 DNA-processing protein DprA [Roseivivax marinus]